MSTIPIHLLNAFVIFNESKNIDAAAASLQITQPALSKQLKQLESFFSQRIFVISGRKKVLTPFGQDLHKRLQERLGNLQDVIGETITLHGQPESSLVRIVARRGVLDRLASCIRFPGRIYFREEANEKALEDLLNLKAEIGIIHKVPNTSELVVKPLFKERFHLVVPKKMLSKRPSYGEVLFQDLQNLPCLGYRPDDEILNSLCEKKSIDLKKLKVLRATENYQSLAEIASAGLGWAVLPTYIHIQDGRCWVLPIPERDLAAKPFFVAYRPQFAKVPWFSELLSEIKQYLATS